MLAIWKWCGFCWTKLGHLETAQLLLNSGADKEAGDIHGRTSLHYASEDGHLEVVRLLLEAGADRNKCTGDGKSPLQLAVDNGHGFVADLLRALPTFKRQRR